LNPGKPLVTVVIIVRNTAAAFLQQALESVREQTLDQRFTRVHVVDDGSDAADSTTMLGQMRESGSFGDLQVTVSRNEKAQGDARCKTASAQEIDTPYLVFLNAKDYLSANFLKTAVLLLEATPEAAWAYPSVQAVGQEHTLQLAPTFSLQRLLFRYDYDLPNVYRTELWNVVGERPIQVTEKYSFYGYWDTLIRLATTGHFGTPMQSARAYFRTHQVSRFSRPARIHLLSIYVTLRQNLWRFPLAVRAHLKHRRHLNRNWGKGSKLNPLNWLVPLQSWAVRRFVHDTSYVLNPQQLMAAIFLPKRFVESFLDSSKTVTLSELSAGFLDKPDPLYARQPRIAPPDIGPKILFAHTWWHLGGAENVLLNWIESARGAGYASVVEFVDMTQDSAREVREQFSRAVDEQYVLAEVGESPGDRRNFAWQYLLNQQPDVLFISGSPMFYALTPYIKRHMPHTKIVDILHNEWGPGDWFNVASDSAESLDIRLVTSEHWREILLERYNTNPEKVLLQANYIDSDRFMPDKTHAPWRKRFGLAEEKKLVAFIGRLHPQKNPQVFLELAKLYHDKPDYHFLVVGDGELMESLVAACSLSNVSFLGACFSLEKLLRAVDVVVFTSRFEGSPLGSLEAAATNVPVVTPDIVGFREQIEGGNFGLMYAPSGEDETDAERIRDLLDNRWDELLKLGGNGRSFVLANHARASCRKRQTEFLTRLRGKTADASVVGCKRKKLFLHIGITKTGSSTIEHFLYRNAQALLQQGLCYPTTMIYGVAHHSIAEFFNERSRRDTPKAATRFSSRAQWERAILAEIAGWHDLPVDDIVLSSEAFRLGKPEQLGVFFKDFDVTVIAYLRRQDVWLESSANQNEKIKGSESLSIDEQKTSSNFLLRYDSFLQPWAAAFGKENIVVVPFEKSAFPCGLERGFLRLLGREAGEDYHYPGVVNPRLSRDCIAYLDEWRKYATFNDSQLHQMILSLERYTAEHPDPPEYKFRLSPEERINILQQYADCNRSVAETYLPESDGILFSEAPPDINAPWAEYPGISDESFADIERFIDSPRSRLRRIWGRVAS